MKTNSDNHINYIYKKKNSLQPLPDNHLIYLIHIIKEARAYGPPLVNIIRTLTVLFEEKIPEFNGI
jgi:hypothetical protein